MDLNRNQFFLAGVLVLLLGIQFRMVDSFVLNPKFAKMIAKKQHRPIATASFSIQAILFLSAFQFGSFPRLPSLLRRHALLLSLLNPLLLFLSLPPFLLQAFSPLRLQSTDSSLAGTQLLLPRLSEPPFRFRSSFVIGLLLDTPHYFPRSVSPRELW